MPRAVLLNCHLFAESPWHSVQGARASSGGEIALLTPVLNGSKSPRDDVRLGEFVIDVETHFGGT